MNREAFNSWKRLSWQKSNIVLWLQFLKNPNCSRFHSAPLDCAPESFLSRKHSMIPYQKVFSKKLRRHEATSRYANFPLVYYCRQQAADDHPTGYSPIEQPSLSKCRINLGSDYQISVRQIAIAAIAGDLPAGTT